MNYKGINLKKMHWICMMKQQDPDKRNKRRPK